MDALFNQGSYVNSPTVGANLTIGGLVFGSLDTNGITFGSGNHALTLGTDGIIVQSGSGAVNTGSAGLTIATGVAENWSNFSSSLLTLGGVETISGTGTFDGSGTGGISVTGPIEGTGTIVINEAASTQAVTFAGNSAISGGFSGLTTITSGTLNITGNEAGTSIALNGGVLNLNNASAVSTSPITINGGFLEEGATNAISGTSALTLTTGSATLSQANNFTGGTTVNGGTLTLTNSLAVQNSTVTPGAGVIAFDQSVTSDAFTFGGLTGSANLALVNNASSPAGIALSIGNNNAATTYSGVLSGTGGSLVKVGTGTTTITGLSNTYSGGTKILNGTLVVTGTLTGASTPLGSGGVTLGDVSGINSATLYFVPAGSTSTPFASNITAQAGSAGLVSIGDNSINNTTNGFSFSGNITLNRNIVLVNGLSGGGTGAFSGNITDASGSNTVSLTADGGRNSAGAVVQNITGTGNTYGGGTVVDGGFWSVGSTSSLGSGNVTVNSGLLTLNSLSNVATGSGKTVTVNSGGVLGIVATSLTQSQITTLVNSASSGVVLINGSTANALNESGIGNGSVFLGSSSGATYSASTLTAGTGSTYYLGGGGGTTAGTGLKISTGVLTGSNAVVVGAPQLNNAPYASFLSGWVDLTAANTYTGGTTVNYGSTLEGLSQASGSPFGSTTSTITLNSGGLQLDNNVNTTNNTTVGQLTFTGNSTLKTPGGGTGTSTLTLGSLVRSNNGGLIINQASNAPILVTSGAPAVTNGIIAPYFTDASGNYLTYSATTGFSTATGTTTTYASGNNVKETAASSVTTSVAVNSLAMSSGAATISSGQTLTITSGGLSLQANGTGVSAGTLAFGSAEGVIYSGAGTQTISSAITGSNGLTRIGSTTGVLTLTGANSGLTGTLTINGGTLSINADAALGASTNTLTLNGATLTVTTTSGQTIAHAINIGAGGASLTSGLNSTTQGQTFSGLISGTGDDLVLTNLTTAGDTDTITLSDASNAFTAPIFIDGEYSGTSTNAVILSIAADGALGASTNSVQLSGQGVLQVTGNVTSTRAISFVDGGGGIDVTGANTYTQNGVLSGDGNFTKSDTGTLDLTASESLTGNTIVSGGALVLTGTLTNSPVIGVGAGATFQIGSGGTAGAISSTAAITDAGTVAFDRSDNNTYNNVISGIGGITQTGTGTTTLSNANTYTGATLINFGQLNVTGSTAAGSAVTIASGAALGGPGTAGVVGGPVTLNSGGFVNLVDGSIGELHIGSLTTSGGGTFDFEIGGGTTATDLLFDNGAFAQTAGTSTITVANILGAMGTPTISTGTYSLIDSSTALSLGSFSLSDSTLDTKNLALQISGDDLELVVTNGSSSTNPTTYTLAESAGALKMHVGGTSTLTTTITNTGLSSNSADALGYTGLGATPTGSLTGTTSSGTISNNGGTGNVAQVFSTSTAGTDTFTATVSTATNNTIGGNAGLVGTAGTATVTVYRYAAPSVTSTVNLGIVHQNGTFASGTLTVGNTDPNDGFSESLDAGFGGTTGGVTTNSGSITLLGASGTDTTTLTVNGSTATTGSLSGTATVTLTSDGSGTSGLGTTGLTSSTVNVTGYVYSGVGTWNAATGGTWGTTQTATQSATNWLITGGTPGISGAPFLTTDSALFGNSIGSSSATVTLGAASPYLNNITFDNTSSGSYTIAQGGTGTIHLDSTSTATLVNSASNNTISAPIELDSAASTSVATSDTLTVSGNVGQGVSPEAMTIGGAGTTVLSGSNTYTGGTTVNTSATLLVSNTTAGGSATGSGALSVGNGATIGGYGTSSGTSFSVSGTGTATGQRANILVGLNSASDTNTSQVLTLIGSSASTIQNANLTFNLKVGTSGALGSDPSGSGTELAVGNTKITFGGATGSVLFSLNMQNEPGIVTAFTPYVLIAGTLPTGGGGVDGSQYTGLTLGNVLVSTGTVTETIIDSNGTNNLAVAFGNSTDQGYYGANSYLVLYQNTVTGADDIDVVVVPEPSTYAMILGGLALLVFWQRRKSNSRK